MKKDLLILGGLFISIIAFLLIGSYLNVFIVGITPQAVLLTQVKMGELEITAEVAKTTQTRSKGLSQREALPEKFGMLFIFDKEDRHSFWMKDTSFPLDIIWIDKDKKIADITHNAQPEPGIPDSLLRIYQPATPVKFVLEVTGGTARKNNLQISQEVEFEL